MIKLVTSNIVQRSNSWPLTLFNDLTQDLEQCSLTYFVTSNNVHCSMTNLVTSSNVQWPTYWHPATFNDLPINIQQRSMTYLLTPSNVQWPTYWHLAMFNDLIHEMLRLRMWRGCVLFSSNVIPMNLWESR